MATFGGPIIFYVLIMQFYFELAVIFGLVSCHHKQNLFLLHNLSSFYSTYTLLGLTCSLAAELGDSVLLLSPGSERGCKKHHFPSSDTGIWLQFVYSHKHIHSIVCRIQTVHVSNTQMVIYVVFFPPYLLFLPL